MIVLSLKTYKESSGDEVIKLARIAEKVNQDTGVPIWLCAQAFDIYRLVQAVKLPIWAQHLDPIDPDRHSGWLSPYSARQVGAVGAVINHAEHTVPLGTIDTTINKCRQYGLKTLVIADTIDLVKQVIDLSPVPVIVGAGIRTGDNVKKTLSLGGVGVILASAVVKAADQEAALRELASGFK